MPPPPNTNKITPLFRPFLFLFPLRRRLHPPKPSRSIVVPNKLSLTRSRALSHSLTSRSRRLPFSSALPLPTHTPPASSASLALHSSFSLASRLLCVHVCLPPLHTHQIQGREDPCPFPRGESNRRCCRRLRPWFRVYCLGLLGSGLRV